MPAREPVVETGSGHIPSCKRTIRFAGRYAGAGRKRFASVEIWYPTRDSNPENHVSENRAYALEETEGAQPFLSRQRGTKNKKPGDLAVQPGLQEEVNDLRVTFLQQQRLHERQPLAVAH